MNWSNHRFSGHKIYGGTREGGFCKFRDNLKIMNKAFEEQLWDTKTTIGKLEFNRRLSEDGIEFDEDNNMIMN